jgi:hypothetical protein
MGKLYNLARMTTATTGTGTITLGSAVSGYLTFALSGVANGDVVDYAIKDGANSEHGTGTYTSAGTTLTRTVTKSTNSNNAISLSGTAEVFISPRAESLITLIGKQSFTASGTYTPTSGMLYCVIECVGGGGGGGGVDGTASQIYQGGGGGSGGYSRLVATAATIGASQTVTIGAAGAAGASGANNGGAGGDTSVGSICIGKGGAGGKYGSSGQVGAGGAGGVAGTGDIVAAGMSGNPGIYNSVNITIAFASGNGGSSFFGGGAPGVAGGGANAGVAASNYGSGGSGASTNDANDAAGGAGSAGFVFITEFGRL